MKTALLAILLVCALVAVYAAEPRVEYDRHEFSEYFNHPNHYRKVCKKCTVKPKVVSWSELNQYAPKDGPLHSEHGPIYQLNLTAISHAEQRALDEHHVREHVKRSSRSNRHRNNYYDGGHAAVHERRVHRSMVQVDSQAEAATEAETELQAATEAEQQATAEAEAAAAVAAEAEAEAEFALAAAAAVDAEAEAPILPAVSSKPAATSAQEKAAKFVSLVHSKIGAAYSWGATGPSTFDCSGLVYWAANQVDRSVLKNGALRTAAQQETAGIPIANIADRKAGDLIFFGKAGQPAYHVGIYVSPNQMIDAPHTGAFVRQENYSYWPDRIGTARRLFH